MQKISANQNSFFKFKELINYKDLLYFLVLKDIKSRYAQSVIGIGWAIIQPVFFMVVFTIIFGRLAKIDSEGVPYAIFSFCALVPWTFFANGVTDSTNSLTANIGMITKIYIPRLLLPISAIIGKGIDFLIALIILVILLFYYQINPGLKVLYVFPLTFLLIISAFGIGTILTTLAVQYRDIKYALPFGIQILMYSSPIAFSSSMIPDKYQTLFAINPMVTVVEGFRYSFLGTGTINTNMIIASLVGAITVLLISLYYFTKTEKSFADVA
tara:strand:- start:2124 stop:2933 length:810 start_codon:yes stop_codon:yes gene_type:complete